eukprot:9649874-Alexandrium_andersonii.AAC.1
MRTVDKESYVKEKIDEHQLVAGGGIASLRSPPRASWKPALLGLFLGAKRCTAQSTELVPVALVTGGYNGNDVLAALLVTLIVLVATL